jgi:hypothetical protein
MFHVPNKYRLRNHKILGSDNSLGNNGFFIIPHSKIVDHCFNIQASDGGLDDTDQKWEHVSVSVAHEKKKPIRCPTWIEMCFVKDLFWDSGDCVIQYHPAKSDYINMHEFVLHLWRPVGLVIQTPPSLMVGINL